LCGGEYSIGEVRYITFFVFAVLLAGCEGSVEVEDGGGDGFDAGADEQTDTDNSPDTYTDTDTNPDADADSGSDSIPDADAGMGGDDGGGADAGGEVVGCADAPCAEREWCQDDVWVCQSGWERSGGECVAIVPTEFQNRTPQGVCVKWNQEHPNRAGWVWEAGADNCDDGTLNPESIDDGIRRINLYRWLVGLYPVYNRRESNAYAQPCAIMMKENGTLNHSPPSDWECYSSEGASGAGHSNLAMGSRDPAGSIEQFIADSRTTSLGHRRWILDPPYLPAGIGHAESWNCTYVMTGGNTSDLDWVAYPAPGPFPKQAVLGKWSLGAWGFDQDQTTVTVKDLTAGTEEQPSFYFPTGWYGSLSYLAFEPSSEQAGHDYEVTVTGVRPDSSQTVTVTYTVQLVDCTQY
jgi:uncharacterized protein YkwD